MLSPAITVVVSLVLVAAIGYVIGLIRGRGSSRDDAAAEARSHGLQNQLDETREREQARMEELRRLRERLAEQDAEMESLRGDVEDRQAAADRGEADAAERVERERALRTELQEARESAAQARRDLEQCADELESTRRELDALGELQRDAEAAATRITQLQEQLQEQDEELRSARAAAIAEPVQLHEPEPEPAVDRLAALNARLHDRDARVERLSGDLADLEERYAGQIRERDLEIERLRERLDEVRAGLEDAEATATAARDRADARGKELADLRHELSLRQTNQERLQAQLAEARQEAMERREALASARRENADLEVAYGGQIEQRAAHIDELQAARERAETRCAELEQQVQSLGRKLDAALMARSEADEAISEREARAQVLQTELRSALEHAESERLVAVANLAEEIGLREQRDGQIKEAQREIGGLREHVGELESIRATLRTQLAEQAADAERQLNERRLEIDHLRSAVDARDAELERSRTATQTATQRAEALERSLEAEQDRAATLQQTLARLEEERHELREQLGRQVAAVEAKGAELRDAEERAERRLRERTRENERLATLLEAREKELSQANERIAGLREQLAVEEQRSDTRDQRIAVLEQEQSRLLRARDHLMRDLHAREQEVRQLRVLANTMPREVDDLEEIDGIGPAIAELLHGVGVRSLRQIASWDRTMMDWLISRQPQLRGRLREEWPRAAAEILRRRTEDEAAED